MMMSSGLENVLINSFFKKNYYVFPAVQFRHSPVEVKCTSIKFWYAKLLNWTQSGSFEMWRGSIIVHADSSSFVNHDFPFSKSISFSKMYAFMKWMVFAGHLQVFLNFLFFFGVCFFFLHQADVFHCSHGCVFSVTQVLRTVIARGGVGDTLTTPMKRLHDVHLK